MISNAWFVGTSVLSLRHQIPSNEAIVKFDLILIYVDVPSDDLLYLVT